MTPFIIAVAGMPGAGKSTLIHNVLQALGDASALHFDDYTRGTNYPTFRSGWQPVAIPINGFLPGSRSISPC